MSDKSKEAEEKKASSLSLTSLLLFFGGLAIGLLIGFFAFRSMAATEDSNDLNKVITGDISSSTEQIAVGVTGSGLASLVPQYNAEAKLGTVPWENEKDYLDFMTSSTGEKPEWLKQRYALAQRYIASKELQGHAIEGFLRTPREDFVRSFNIKRAYEDTWMPIGYGATITDPDVVSMMTTSLDVKPGHRILEIGNGSGYQSGILSNISNFVFSIEIIDPLQKETDALYTALSEKYPQYKNIKRKLGDGYYGWEEYAPFDRIIVTCSIDHLPPPLMQQLSNDGIIVVPLGPPGRQHIMEVKKSIDTDGNQVIKRRDVYNGVSVQFIPFRDEAGTSYSGKK